MSRFAHRSVCASCNWSGVWDGYVCPECGAAIPGLNYPLIAVCGPARHGKDTFITGAVCSRIGVSRLAWADGVKAIAQAMLGLSREQTHGIACDRDMPWFGDGSTIRDALVAIGMLGRRFEPDAWVRATVNNTRLRYGTDRAQAVMVSGTRFPNEVEACDYAVWVERPNYVRVVNVAEEALDLAALGQMVMTGKLRGVHLVRNTQDVPALHAQADRVLDRILDDWRGRRASSSP